MMNAAISAPPQHNRFISHPAGTVGSEIRRLPRQVDNEAMVPATVT